MKRVGTQLEGIKAARQRGFAAWTRARIAVVKEER